MTGFGLYFNEFVSSRISWLKQVIFTQLELAITFECAYLDTEQVFVFWNNHLQSIQIRKYKHTG